MACPLRRSAENPIVGRPRKGMSSVKRIEFEGEAWAQREGDDRPTTSVCEGVTIRFYHELTLGCRARP